jgi:hypothetical protein
MTRSKSDLFDRYLVLPALLAIMILAILSTFPTSSFAQTRPSHPSNPNKMIRKVEVSPDQVTEIHTAIGYSTILDFTAKPLSAVLGDQDAFKLEFVGSSITVKPLLVHAKSNLFVFTEFDRFNIQLSSGDATLVDYIVSLTRRGEDQGEVEPSSDLATTPTESLQLQSSSPREKVIQRSKKLNGIELKVVSKSETISEIPGRTATVITIELTSQRLTYAFSPASIGIKVGGRFVPIESIYLDALSIGPRLPVVHGKIALLKQDLTAGTPVVVFAISDSKNKKASRLEVSTQARSAQGPKTK